MKKSLQTENILKVSNTERGSIRVPGTDGRADKRFALLGRYSSEIRTGCANERSSGSVRGAPGNWCPYRDRQP